MSSANIDPAALLNRFLEYAAQNLRVEKLLIQIGLDPANITYDAVFNRLFEIALANINFANMLALCGAVLYVATLMMRTMVPLRIIGILSIVFFIGYGALAGAVATFLPRASTKGATSCSARAIPPRRCSTPSAAPSW